MCGVFDLGVLFRFEVSLLRHQSLEDAVQNGKYTWTHLSNRMFGIWIVCWVGRRQPLEIHSLMTKFVDGQGGFGQGLAE